MSYLILRFDAPLMSFGGVLVDQHNRTERFPGRAMLTGLIANALGWRHRDADALNDLQSQIEYAARWDVPPTPLRDYHTVDLGQPHLAEPGWTTRGSPEHRAGGDSKKGTHQRYRHYWANGVMTLALTLREGTNEMATIASALRRPARPLFLGRKTCLPASRLVIGLRESTHTLAALIAEPRDCRTPASTDHFEACWPPGCEDAQIDTRHSMEGRTDERDWRIQAHVGRRRVITGYISGVPICT